METSLTMHSLHRIPKEEVAISQLWNRHCDVTYSPIANKIFNLLTQQAGGVMTASNGLLDRFIAVVLSRLYPDIDSDDLSSHRRYCSLSIFTAGSKKQLCDGFANTPHIDKKDVFQQNFQREARKLLTEIRGMYCHDDDVMKDLQYLETLADFPTGFCVPTTCGYAITSTATVACQDISQHDAIRCTTDIPRQDICDHDLINITDFAMIGLGVAVTIRAQAYHYFMASQFTHCTPVPTQVHRSGYVSYFTGQYNVVGWGGGQAGTHNTYQKKERTNIRKRKRMMK